MVKTHWRGRNRGGASTSGLQVLIKQAAEKERNNKRCEENKTIVPSLPLSNPSLFIISISKRKKKGEKELNICPFRKQIYVTYSRKKEGGGILGFYAFWTIQTPNTQYSAHEGLRNYPYIGDITLPVKTSPPCPLLKRRLTVLSLSRDSATSGMGLVLQGDRAERGEGAPWRTKKRGRYLGRKKKGSTNPAFGTPDGTGQDRTGGLIASPVVAVVCRLVDLRFLLNGGVLTALSRATLKEETIKLK